MIFRELSNAVFRFVLRSAGAEIDGGGVQTPPPAGRGKSRGPAGRGLIAPDRRSRSGPDKHHSMRQGAGTTMALDTWRHVPRGTCHVPPRGPLAKQHELDTFFEGTVAETQNLQGRCTLVWRMCHVSDDPVGSKLCPQGIIPFFQPYAL